MQHQQLLLEKRGTIDDLCITAIPRILSPVYTLSSPLVALPRVVSTEGRCLVLRSSGTPRLYFNGFFFSIFTSLIHTFQHSFPIDLKLLLFCIGFFLLGRFLKDSDHTHNQPLTVHYNYIVSHSEYLVNNFNRRLVLSFESS